MQAMPKATKLRIRNGGFPSGYSEWLIEGEKSRFRFCRMLPKSGEISPELRAMWGVRGWRLVAAAFGSSVGLFEELAWPVYVYASLAKPTEAPG